MFWLLFVREWLAREWVGEWRAKGETGRGGKGSGEVVVWEILTGVGVYMSMLPIERLHLFLQRSKGKETFEPRWEKVERWPHRVRFESGRWPHRVLLEKDEWGGGHRYKAPELRRRAQQMIPLS